MATETTSSENLVLRQSVLGARRFSNYFWATIVSIGAMGFFLAAISSYTKVNLLPFSDPTQLLFVPQGIAMGFYGTAGLLLASYLWLSIVWDLGGGYNEFNKETGEVKIFRWGFPGKNRRVELDLKTSDVQAVKATLREGVNPRRSLYLRVKGMRDIPLTRVGQPMTLAELENEAAGLARFLSVPLEGL
ncbi:photosystem I assembly protein Ycf4 [Leptolyngbya sp. NIES-2104]|uniref:photosystem I assembly protein Ycf4 n=1 Tax=Leptolyngbya sp. NIES-2104 TaxID=1552121 RepID=UPI0006EC7A97|nr:photosystem I assembly protein Ycf4 [Leptolyngbya sp. NIES-2104]GAP98482.1 photosystem I assembly related protein Ycf4 [Leptolyngbya sp. NIES-2104]